MALTKEQLKNISEHAKYMAMTSSRETLEKMFVEQYLRKEIEMDKINDSCK